MSDIATLFPSKWLAAADLKDEPKDVQIKQIIPSEEVGSEKQKKPILFFKGVEKGLVLNKTNAKRIAKLYGNDTDEWIGKFITIYPSECDFRDETVQCIRVKPEAPKMDEPADDDDLTDEEMAALIKAKRKKKSAASA